MRTTLIEQFQNILPNLICSGRAQALRFATPDGSRRSAKKGIYFGTVPLLLLLSLSSIVVAQETSSNPPESTPAESAPRINSNEATVGDGRTVLQGEKPSDQSLLRLQVVFVPDGIEQRIQRSTELSDQEQAAVPSFLTSAFRSNGSVSDKGTQQTHVDINRTVASAAIDRLIRVYRILSKDDVSCSATESFSEVTLRRGLDIGAADKTLWQVRELEKRDGTRGFQLKRQMEPDPGDTNQEPTSVAVTVRFSASETAVLPWYFHFLEEDIRKASRERWHGEHFLLIDTVNTESTPGESASKKDTTEATAIDGGTVLPGGKPSTQTIERQASVIAKALESATDIALNAGSSLKLRVYQANLNTDSRQRLGEIIAKLINNGTIELGATFVKDSGSMKTLTLNFTEQEYEDGGNLLPDVVAELRRQQDQQENKERQSQIQALLGTNESGQETKLVELPLRHAKPADVAKVLNEQFPSITFSAATDSVFGRVSEADLTAVDRLVRALETKAMDPAQREQERKYKWDFAPINTVEASSAFEVRLKHISASDAIDTLQQLGLITDKLLAVASPNGNAILFRVTETEKGRPSPIVAARQIIDHIDVPTKVSDAPPASKIAPRADKPAIKHQSAYDWAELQSAQIAMELRMLRATGRNAILIPMHIQKLRESVQTAFDLRMRLQQAQLAEAEADLKLARERLARRQQIADKIIDRRIQELQSEEDTSWQGNQKVSQSSSGDKPDEKSPVVSELRGSSESLEHWADSTDTIEANRPNAETKTLKDERSTGVATLRFGFNFSNTPWMDVLTYIGDTLSLSIDVQEIPTGGLSLLRSNLTAGEAIDELNRKLAAQSLTIQQTPTFLIVKPLATKLPADPDTNQERNSIH